MNCLKKKKSGVNVIIFYQVVAPAIRRCSLPPSSRHAFADALDQILRQCSTSPPTHQQRVDMGEEGRRRGRGRYVHSCRLLPYPCRHHHRALARARLLDRGGRRLLLRIRRFARLQVSSLAAPVCLFEPWLPPVLSARDRELLVVVRGERGHLK